MTWDCLVVSDVLDILGDTYSRAKLERKACRPSKVCSCIGGIEVMAGGRVETSC